MDSQRAEAPAVSLVGVRVVRGRTVVLDELNLSVASGAVTAVLGRNGAGKSSLMACLAGLAPLAQGQARVLGLDPWRDRRRLFERLAYVPEVPDAPANVRVRDLLAFDRAVCPHFDEVAAKRRIDRADIALGALAGALSRGQKTQLALALALAREPELLLLDDPTLGLDPLARRTLLDELVDTLAERGPTVVVATHDLDLAERLAQDVVLLAGGRVRVAEPLEALRERVRRLTLAPGVTLPPEFAVLAELGVDGLGREVLATGPASELDNATALGRPAALVDIVTAHLEAEKAL